MACPGCYNLKTARIFESETKKATGEYICLRCYRVFIPAPTHIYNWKNNEKRASLYGRRLFVIARLKMNTLIVEFEGGQREAISRYALKRIQP